MESVRRRLMLQDMKATVWVLPKGFGRVTCGHPGCKRAGFKDLEMMRRGVRAPSEKALQNNKRCRVSERARAMKELDGRSSRRSRMGKLVVVVGGVESSCMMDVVDRYRGIKRRASIGWESVLTKRGRLEREADERCWFEADLACRVEITER